VGKPTAGLMPDGARPWPRPVSARSSMTCWPAASAISAFGRAAGAFLGHRHDPGGHPVTINRLRGLAFGNGGLAGDTTTLFFAGLTNEADGQTGTFGSFPGFQGQTGTYGPAGTAQAPVAAGASIKGSNAFGATDHAFRWAPATGLRDLGVLPGGDQSIAIAISAGENVVVGGFWHAFRWTAATGMTDLGTLGGPESAELAANRDGSVIAGSSLTSQSTGSSQAFRWTAKTGMQTWAKLVSAPQRLIVQSAVGVSQDGTVIIGNGFSTRLGRDEPWRVVLPLA
jgi:probable HAF family extracellular repeat protein